MDKHQHQTRLKEVSQKRLVSCGTFQIYLQEPFRSLMWIRAARQNVSIRSFSRLVTGQDFSGLTVHCQRLDAAVESCLLSGDPSHDKFYMSEGKVLSSRLGHNRSCSWTHCFRSRGATDGFSVSHPCQRKCCLLHLC